MPQHLCPKRCKPPRRLVALIERSSFKVDDKMNLRSTCAKHAHSTPNSRLVSVLSYRALIFTRENITRNRNRSRHSLLSVSHPLNLHQYSPITSSMTVSRLLVSHNLERGVTRRQLLNVRSESRLSRVKHIARRRIVCQRSC